MARNVITKLQRKKRKSIVVLAPKERREDVQNTELQQDSEDQDDPVRSGCFARRADRAERHPGENVLEVHDDD
jgi:hypothetical protein